MDQQTLEKLLDPGDPSLITDVDDMFDSCQVEGVVKLFKEADEDGSGGLDIEEFCTALQKIYKSIPTDELVKLHMKIDTNCDGTVDLTELMDFVIHKNEVLQTLDPRSQLFPNPATVIPVGRKNLVKIVSHPLDNENKSTALDNSDGGIRPYVKCRNLAVSTDGLLRCWTQDMQDSFVVPLHKNEQRNLTLSHRPRMHVSDMAYISELDQVVFSTSIKELLFFNCSNTAAHFNLAYVLEEEYRVTSMHYCSDDSTGILAYGAEKGCLTLLISNNVKENGLICSKAFQKTPLKPYKVCHVSTLLRLHSQSFVTLRISVFSDDCAGIIYFPELQSFAVCSRSSSMMALVRLTRGCHGFSQKVSKRCFNSPDKQQYFTCVEYSPRSKLLLTGGTGGCLRVLSPYRSKSSSSVETLTGHTAPITHLAYNPTEKIFLSVSEDKNIRMWLDESWLCSRSFYIHGMKDVPISSMCYNTLNNELYLANTHLGHFFGSGTDVFQSLLRSHYMPLTTVLYHKLFKQVISICQAGVVSVWDALTGKAVMQFKVTPENCVGPTTMSFDPTQRKLIIVTSDGKLSFWNFNNGKELYVHPVVMPNQVTAIVCSTNRVCISMKDSNRIFDLDTEGEENRFLQHHLLKDVTGMDLHESMLIATSSDNNLVVWNLNRGNVMYTMNNTCPWVMLATKADQGIIADLPCKIFQSNELPKTSAKVMSCVLCLKTRPFNKDTATVLVSAHGYISAWATTIRGRLIAKFRAVNDGTYITCMSTNTDESVLLTGHSYGMVCLWDIGSFGYKANEDDEPCQIKDGQKVSLRPPPLLTSWQAHPTEVVSVLYVQDEKKIITAGLDCYLKQWTDRGHRVGIYGKDKWDEKTVTSSLESLDTKPNTVKTDLSELRDELLRSPTPPIVDVEEFWDRVELAVFRIECEPSPKVLKYYKRMTNLSKELRKLKTEHAEKAEEIEKVRESVQQCHQTAMEKREPLQKHRPTPGGISALKSSPPAGPASCRPKLTPLRLRSPSPPNNHQPPRTADAPRTASRHLPSQRPLHLPPTQSKDGLKPHPPVALRSRNPRISVEGFKTEQKNTDTQKFSEKFTLEDAPWKNLAIKPRPPQKPQDTEERPWQVSRRLRMKAYFE